jgi:hypothetical protein
VWFEPNGPGSNHGFRSYRCRWPKTALRQAWMLLMLRSGVSNLSAPDVIENHDVDTLLALDGYHHSGRLAWHLYLSPL